MGGKIFAALVLLGLGVTVSAQEVRYVTDALRLEMRTGPDTSFKIVRMLASGSEVTILEEQDGYSQVRTKGGREAWILTRYLQREPAARAQLAEVMFELGTLRAEKANFAHTLGEASGVSERAQATLEEAQRDNEALNTELIQVKEAASSTLATRRENGRLTVELKALKAELDGLATETRALKEGREREWFLAGAGVLGAGIMVGLVAPSLVRRRRRSRSDF